MPSRPDKKVLSDRGCIGRQPNVLCPHAARMGGRKQSRRFSPSLAALLSLKTQTTGLANQWDQRRPASRLRWIDLTGPLVSLAAAQPPSQKL